MKNESIVDAIGEWWRETYKCDVIINPHNTIYTFNTGRISNGYKEMSHMSIILCVMGKFIVIGNEEIDFHSQDFFEELQKLINQKIDVFGTEYQTTNN